MIVIPKQHGAWAILAASFIIGAAAGGFSVESFFVLAGAILSFIAYHSLAMGFMNTGFRSFFVRYKKWERSLLGEILTTLILCTTAPAAAYAGSGRLGKLEVISGIACGVFFTLRILHVRYLVRHKNKAVSVRHLGYRELMYASLFVIVSVIVLKK